jgi:hypothetical protein
VRAGFLEAAWVPDCLVLYPSTLVVGQFSFSFGTRDIGIKRFGSGTIE